MLEVSGQKFKITMINMLRALMDKMDDMPEQMSNTSTEMELQRENFLKKEMLQKLLQK